MNKDFSIRDFALVMSLAVVWIFFYFMDPHFIGSRNLTNLAIEFSMASILALGMLLIILSGEIDLSVGSGVGLAGGITCVLITQESSLSAPFAMLLAIVVIVALWFAMGKLITSQSVPSFIITLGGMLVFRGAFEKTISNDTISVTKGGEENLLSILTTHYFPGWQSLLIFAVVAGILYISMLSKRKREKEFGFEVEGFEKSFLKVFVVIQSLLLMTLVMNQNKGVPLSFLILGITALFIHTLTKHTAFGRHLYAIGGNKEAAEISGINVKKTVTVAFVILGVIVAITGFLQVAYQGSSTNTIGEYMELDAIAACVIGGVSLSGGRGSVGGVLIGSLLMASLLNGMTLLAMGSADKFIARGAVLVLAVWMDVYLSKGRK